MRLVNWQVSLSKALEIFSGLIVCMISVEQNELKTPHVT